jgi:hypothetical protein
MSTRRSHGKSRRGCVTCKSRHVRCDESGPPCDRCRIRGTPCEYTSSKTSSQPSSSNRVANTKHDNREPTPPRDLATTSEVVFPADSHLLELQLMHRWSALTYKHCCSPGSNDAEVWQFLVPKLALQYDFLLYGIFALSAFEIAQLSNTLDSQRYLSAAIEYHGRALGSFQRQLPVIIPKSHEAALCMSSMLIPLAFASALSNTAQDSKYTMVNTVLTHFQLLQGCIPVFNIDQEYINGNPYMAKVKPYADLPRIPLDSLTEEAFAKLGVINDKRITASLRDTDERRLKQVTYWEACKKALAVLQECQEKCVDDLTGGFALGWLNMTGEEFVKAIKDEDHISLVILMYWGVLADKLGSQVWWMENFGKRLAEEISNQILGSEYDLDLKEIILQAHIQAGLPNKGCVL